MGTSLVASWDASGISQSPAIPQKTDPACLGRLNSPPLAGASWRVPVRAPVAQSGWLLRMVQGRDGRAQSCSRKESKP